MNYVTKDEDELNSLLNNLDLNLLILLLDLNHNKKFNKNFITVKATIFPGISDISYSEVEKLQKLLISRKDDIDHILELQPVYAIGIDFQNNSTRPCITCWVAKPFDITVLECLETIFEDQFEVIYKIIAPLNINEYFINNEEDLKDEDGNDNNNGNGNGGGSGSNNHQNSNNNNNNGNNGNKNTSNNGNNFSGDNGNNNYGGDDDGGDDGGDDGDSNNGGKKKEDRIYISSSVNAGIINSDFLQDFNISANLWAKISPYENNVKVLEYNINVNDCGIGDMLSNQCPLLNKIGLGYLLHSIEIHVSPLPINGKKLFGLKDFSQPKHLNRNIEFSMGIENSIGGQIGIPKILDSNITGSVKNNCITKYSSNEWELCYKSTIKGDHWLYQYIDTNLDKVVSHRENFIPGVHSSQWFIHEGMHGFYITITQVLRCEITRGWRRFLPNTKISLQQFPMMTHNLKVTFNNLNNFNSKLKKLNKTYYYNDDIITIVGNNRMENKFETQNILTLNNEKIGEIKCSLDSI
ncbi:hypothetical protein RhiirA4_415984 [Rhizophagus irregularis]|uniref:Uncharacterized protein n=1 Tax=Rhizophagus irregularis TaxID=588596 RepID=A0A2I1G1W0_9GLOM|nr:hypothetical protein RhiirA4_415984 [Rhizophagus irregularis]